MSIVAHKHLQNMGFTEKEAKVYMTCLKNGPCTVKQLADDCGVKRPTTYVMLESLMEKELVELVKRGKKTFFSAHHPNALRKHVERERQALAKKDAILDELMPMLASMATETATQAA